MTGNWPREWDDDPEDGFLDDSGELTPAGDSVADEAQLAEVSAWLAAAPAPVLPDAVEARIMATLAAESARSGSGDHLGPLSSLGTHPRVLGPAPHRARVRRRAWMQRALTAGGAVVVCLLFVGFGFVLSRGSSSSSSSAASGAVAEPTRAGSTTAGSSSAGSGSAGSGSSAAEPLPAGRSEAVPGPGVPLTVTETGTRYEQSTLASQVLAVESVRSNMTFGTDKAAPTPGASSAPAAPAASAPAASASTTAAPLTSALRGCVLHLTGNKAASLIDRSTYNGTLAYVIATTSHVWVVGLGCTSGRPELITSVPLAG